tara:strand:- start:21 stop:254 length:234 start_codon:yes stop_codon:yes gene_type:complete
MAANVALPAQENVTVLSEDGKGWTAPDSIAGSPTSDGEMTVSNVSGKAYRHNTHRIGPRNKPIHCSVPPEAVSSAGA